MNEICSKKQCIGCLNCYNSCKFSAIKIVKDELDFLYPIIDGDNCKKCGLCKKVCPILSNSYNTQNNKCYACYNIEESIRLRSSSGGIFYLLAKFAIDNGGIVYGAGFNKKHQLIHMSAKNLKDLKKLMGSKYVQSNLNNIFLEIKSNLDSNILVYFSGTPCQVSALKKYLGKDYLNLITQDFICHGVGSNKVLNMHLDKIMQEYNIKRINKIDFRNKTTGWKNFSFSLNKKYIKDLNSDIFMKTFLKNLCLRESCYHCSFKGNKRASDLTLGDFWQVENVIKNIDDDKGVSCAIINTIKGEKIFSKIVDKMNLYEVSYDDISKNNIALEHTSIYNSHRELFIKNIIDNGDLSNIDDKYYRK